MKKFYFMMAAVSVMMLNACTSEDDVLQATGPQTTVQEAVGFDVYVPEAVNATRAGLEGALTTSRLQRSEYEGGGFGVYAFQVQDEVSTAGDKEYASSYLANGPTSATNYRLTPIAPNFMVNEKLLWNATNQGWYYNPLKYWPNETDNDSQTSAAEMLGDATHNHIDRLTFFAYAPYVEKGKDEIGITHLTNKLGYLDTDPVAAAVTTGTVIEPCVGYKASLKKPDEAVDLLWGVAPAGGLTYTAVNGKTVNVKEGEPLMDMTKPDVNTNMKFLFQHALARIGVTAVAAIDQVGPGGNLDPNTKITIQKITLTGLFGETGVLNLDNEKASVANWTTINGVDLKANSGKTTVAALFTGDPITLELVADNTAGEGTNHQLGTIARHLQFVGTPATNPYDVSAAPEEQTDRIGVTTVRQNVIMPAKINNAAGANRNWYTYKQYAANELKYSETTPYYTDADCSIQPAATVYGLDGTTPTSASYFVYQVDDKGVYTESSAAVTLTYPAVNDYYTLTFLEVIDNGDTPTATQITETAAAGMQGYTKSGKVYTPEAVGKAPSKGNSYVIKCDANGDPIINKAVAAYTAATKYYKRDANYFMVVPTNNVKNIVTGLTDEEKLRTVRVMIEYYITTKDSKLNGGLAQTKNVITKDVVFPSLANGKSYNLNLVLGLTSVKMEAEVDDWKVINVQGDLPQNTAE